MMLSLASACGFVTADMGPSVQARNEAAAPRIGQRKRPESRDGERHSGADLHAKVRLGGDPAADKAVGKANAALTFKAIADQYLAWQKKRLRPRSYVEVTRHITAGRPRRRRVQLSSAIRRHVPRAVPRSNEPV